MNQMHSESHDHQEPWICEAQQGDKQAIEYLIQKNRKLVEKLSRRVCCDSAYHEELVQAGNLGLLHAIERFDAARDVKLMTYAVSWILGEMRRAIKNIRCDEYSLDQGIAGDGLTLYDVLPGEPGIDIAWLDLRLALSRLNREEQLLICLRYYRDKSQKETAAALGKSQTQISRIESHALEKLRAQLN